MVLLIGCSVSSYGMLVRGASVVKVDSIGRDAFDSPRLPLIGVMRGTQLAVDAATVLAQFFFHALDNPEMRLFESRYRQRHDRENSVLVS